MDIDPNELYAVPENERLDDDADDEFSVADRNPETTLEDDVMLAESLDDGEIRYMDEEE